jgi:FAD/FMN-containing dehydrogenase
MRAIAIEGVDDENFGLDATLQQGQIGRNDSVGAKADIAKSVLTSAPSIASGIKSLARMAVAGDRALKAATYAVHYLADGVDQAEARAKIALIRRIALASGEELPNTVPTVVRGMPFAPLTNILGPKGERWVPMHGLFAHDRVLGFHEALGERLDSHRPDMERLGVTTGAMFMAVRSTAFVYEPTFYWPDDRTDFHDRMVPPDHLSTLPQYSECSEARSLVNKLKHEVAKIMTEFGAAHLQIGKFYPYLEGRNAPAAALIRAVKRELDPMGIMNPGVLGL